MGSSSSDVWVLSCVFSMDGLVFFPEEDAGPSSSSDPFLVGWCSWARVVHPSFSSSLRYLILRTRFRFRLRSKAIAWWCPIRTSNRPIRRFVPSVTMDVDSERSLSASHVSPTVRVPPRRELRGCPFRCSCSHATWWRWCVLLRMRRCTCEPMRFETDRCHASFWKHG